MTSNKSEKIQKLDNLDNLNVNRRIFISKEHQKVMATEGEDEISEETRLTKGDKTPNAAQQFDNSAILTLMGKTSKI